MVLVDSPAVSTPGERVPAPRGRQETGPCWDRHVLADPDTPVPGRSIGAREGTGLLATSLNDQRCPSRKPTLFGEFPPVRSVSVHDPQPISLIGDSGAIG